MVFCIRAYLLLYFCRNLTHPRNGKTLGTIFVGLKSRTKIKIRKKEKKPISFSFVTPHFCEQVIQSLLSVFHISFWFCFFLFVFGFSGSRNKWKQIFILCIFLGIHNGFLFACLDVCLMVYVSTFFLFSDNAFCVLKLGFLHLHFFVLRKC